MEEIKVGDYVRTKDGFIYKIEDGEEFYEDSIDVGVGVIPDIDGIWVDKGHFCYVERRNIVKHSKLISEVIEVGDYVNGILVTGKEGTLLYTEIKGIDGSGYHIPISQYGDNIENIVTKEQFKNVSYEV